MIHPELHLQIAKQRIGDMMRDVEQGRLLRSLARPTWPGQQIRGLLCRLGYWLIRVGQQQRQQTDYSQHERLIP